MEEDRIWFELQVHRILVNAFIFTVIECLFMHAVL